MPISVESNYKYLKDLLSKNNDGYITPSEYSRYAQKASLELFDELVGSKNQPRTAYGRNRVLDHRLEPFKRRTQLNFVSGKVTKPTNCAFIRSIYTTGDNPIPVKPTDEDREAMLFQNPFVKPSDTNLWYVEDQNELRLLGVNSLSVWIEYLETPVKPKYAISGRDYDPVASVDFDWDERQEEEITMRILNKAGLSIQDTLSIQYANNSKAQE